MLTVHTRVSIKMICKTVGNRRSGDITSDSTGTVSSLEVRIIHITIIRADELILGQGTYSYTFWWLVRS